VGGGDSFSALQLGAGGSSSFVLALEESVKPFDFVVNGINLVLAPGESVSFVRVVTSVDGRALLPGPGTARSVIADERAGCILPRPAKSSWKCWVSEVRNETTSIGFDSSIDCAVSSGGIF
jgi:hypothetical protein